MKYNVGDKVRVKDNLKTHEYYGHMLFLPSMEKLKGKIVTIKEVDTAGTPTYVLDKSILHFWTDEMLEDIKENKKMSKLEDLEIKYKELGEEIERLKLEEKSKVWKPKEYEEIWYIDKFGDVDNDIFSRGSWDEERYKLGNCFKTQEEAEKVAEKIKIYTELKRYALEHNEEFDTVKYYICIQGFEIKTGYCSNKWFQIGQIYFSSNEIAEQAIKEIGEEKIKKLFEEEE